MKKDGVFLSLAPFLVLEILMFKFFYYENSVTYDARSCPTIMVETHNKRNLFRCFNAMSSKLGKRVAP